MLYLRHLQMALLTSCCPSGREDEPYRILPLVSLDPSQPSAAQPCAEGSCPIWSVTMALLPSGFKEITIIESAMGIQARGGQGRGEPGQHQDQWYCFPLASASCMAPCGTVTGLPLFKILILCSIWFCEVTFIFRSGALKYYFSLITEFFDAPLILCPREMPRSLHPSLSPVRVFRPMASSLQFPSRNCVCLS